MNTKNKPSTSAGPSQTALYDWDMELKGARLTDWAEREARKAGNDAFLNTDEGRAYWALLDRRDELASLLACLERAWAETSAHKTREALDALRKTRDELGDLDRQLAHFEQPAADAAEVVVEMRAAMGSAPATTAAVSRTALEQTALLADERVAHPAAAPPSPPPLTTSALALLFDGVIRDNREWKRMLADCPVWLSEARLQKGAPGKVSALWNPVTAASLVMGRAKTSESAMRAAFTKASHFSPEIDAWVPAWREYEAGLSWGTSKDT